MKFILVADGVKSRIEAAFFPLWQALLFVCIVSLILLLLIPKNLLQNALEMHEPSGASLSYLQAFKRMYPGNKQIIYALTEQQIYFGQLESAQNNIIYLKSTLDEADAFAINQQNWLVYLMLRHKTYRSKMNTTTRIAYLHQLRQMAERLSNTPLEPRQLKVLAKDNLSLDEPGRALKIYNNLWTKQQLTDTKELVEAGNVAMQNNAHQDSSKFYWAAYQKAKAYNQKRQYAYNALKVLWAGNYVKEALLLAKQLPPSMLDSREMLVLLTRLSMAANQPKIAQKYIMKALIGEL